MREVAAFGTDRTGRIVEWGPAATLLLGHEEQEALGHGAAELLAPTEGRAWAGALRQAVSEDRAVTGVFTVRHRDGRLLEVEAWLVATRDPEGRAEARALLAESQEPRQARGTFTVLDTFFGQAPIGLAILDAELRFRRANPVLAAMNGLPEHRHLDRGVAEVVPGLNVEQMDRALRRVLETGEPPLDFRSIGRTGRNPDHDRVWSESCFRLEDARGRPLGVAAVVIDITAHEQDYLGSAAGRARVLGPGRAVTWTWPHDPAAIGDVRTAVARQLAAWNLPDLEDTTTLIAGELATNAVRHAEGPFQVRLVRTDDALTCEITEDSSTSPRLRHAEDDDEGDRGLFLTAQLTTRRGVRPTARGKTIWAEQALPGPDPATDR
ncbi:PAS domain-containing protein [Streptomyces adustus]